VKRKGSAWCTDYRQHDREEREEGEEAFRTRVALEDGVVQAGTGELFLCALTAGGAVWCEGVNDMGQLGRGRSSAVETGGFVPRLRDVRRSSVAQQSACALRADGSVWCWGGFRYLEKGPTPSRVSGCVSQLKPVPALELDAPPRSAKSSARPGEPL
jgi:alpha-tubulin suppressor-like RCC1 family protein